MVWVVDDDPERKMVGTYLIDQGYDVRCLCDVKQLEARLECQRPDLLVLDVMLPGDDGLTALRRLRDAGDDLPVVMLTARGEAVDRIIGLEQGADDYLGKPFLPRELTARIDAVLRRRMALPAGTPLQDGEEVSFGEYVLDLSSRTLLKAGRQEMITSGEFSLLLAFVQHPHRPLSRVRLIELARGPGSDTDSRSMDVQVSRVRKLVEPDPTVRATSRRSGAMATSSSRTELPALAEMTRLVFWRPLVLQISAWSSLLLGSWLLCLMLMQLLFGRELTRLQTLQLGRDLALNIRLTELTLEHYPPALIKEFTGLDLVIAVQPPGPEQRENSNDDRLLELQKQLCERLSHCPMLLPADSGEDSEDQGSGQQIWIELISPLEPVWLRSNYRTHAAGHRIPC